MSERIYENLKYPFSDGEIRELGETLAREAQIVFDLQEQKKTETAALAAEIKAANKRVADLTTKINNRYELREIECMYRMEDPRPGMKTLMRLDNNEQVRIEPMTAREMQQSFGFSEGEDR